MNVLRNAPVLVPACATAQGVNAAWRAALVARDLGVALRLLQLAPHLAPVSAQMCSLQRLALEIKAHLGIDVELTHATEHALAATVRAAREAALVVIGPRPGNPLRQLVLGTQAEQLIRLCRVPVLVVKRPATASYRRVLVPVELTPAARPVIATAARLSRDPRVEVLHALAAEDGLALRLRDLSPARAQRERHRLAERARGSLRELIAQSTGEPGALRPHVDFGDAAKVVLARERTLGPDLVVIGKRTRGLLADFFLGGVTQRVLAATRSDVLVLPVASEQGRSAAMEWGVRAT